MKKAAAKYQKRLLKYRTDKAVRLLGRIGKLSEYAKLLNHSQVEKAFIRLQHETDKARERLFKAFYKGSDYENERILKYPGVSLGLPDGTLLRAAAFEDENFPAINIYAIHPDKPCELLCFAEYNSERAEGHRLCIGVYQSDTDDTTYYEPYAAERDSNERTYIRQIP